MARLVVPHYPHHVTQRGNRRQQVFFCDDDYLAYIDLLADAKQRAGVEIWAYCLMPNHVHLVATPDTQESLSQCFSKAHRRYTRRINFREGWRGYLWQGRFHSYVMDEAYLLATVRYVELNPVRAGLCKSAGDWKWSSAKAHTVGEDDNLVMVKPMLNRISDWSGYLNEKSDPQRVQMIRKHNATGRPLGDDRFLDDVQRITGNEVRKRKPGPRSK